MGSTLSRFCAITPDDDQRSDPPAYHADATPKVGLDDELQLKQDGAAQIDHENSIHKVAVRIRKMIDMGGR